MVGRGEDGLQQAGTKGMVEVASRDNRDEDPLHPVEPLRPILPASSVDAQGEPESQDEQPHPRSSSVVLEMSTPPSRTA